ncbi:hypothetical protein [Thiomonas sp.]
MGKDTAAAYLTARHGFRQASFAARLYQEVAQAYGVPESELSRRDLKEVPQNRFAARHCRNPEFRAVLASLGKLPDEPLSPRFGLQVWGTEYRRSQSEDYWLRPVRDLVERNPGRWVITDPRHLNEFDWVESLGFLGKIDRPALPPLDPGKPVHASDLAARERPVAFRLVNEENALPRLYAGLDEVLGKLLD